MIVFLKMPSLESLPRLGGGVTLRREWIINPG
jgi:hypothetical protein